MNIQSISIDHITAMTDMQSRCTLNPYAADGYAERMIAGDKFPPIVVFCDGTSFFLADGFHRLAAAIKNNATHIDCDVMRGGKLDALKYAIGSNKVHGVSRSNADKQRCVRLALQHFGDMSNVAIAELVGVAAMTVLRARQETDNLHIVQVTALTPPEPITRLGRDGKRRPAFMQPAPATVTQAIAEVKILCESQWLAAYRALWPKMPDQDCIDAITWHTNTPEQRAAVAAAWKTWARRASLATEGEEAL